MVPTLSSCRKAIVVYIYETLCIASNKTQIVNLQSCAKERQTSVYLAIHLLSNDTFCEISYTEIQLPVQ